MTTYRVLFGAAEGQTAPEPIMVTGADDLNEWDEDEDAIFSINDADGKTIFWGHNRDILAAVRIEE